MTTTNSIPPANSVSVCFAHVAYQMAVRFEARKTEIKHMQAWNREELLAALPTTDVLAIGRLWQNDMLDRAPKLRFIQAMGAGYNQFDLEALRARGIRFATASGVNSGAVSEHTIAMMLALARHIHTGRDNQRAFKWRPLIGDIQAREDELAGKTVAIVGLGAIGSRVARLAKAFDMRVIAIRQNVNKGGEHADRVLAPSALPELLAEADFVVLTCPLAEDTKNLINAAALAQMKPSAYLINVARGACVDESALVDALRTHKIAGAGLDAFINEPLPADSPLWGFDNVVITPHTAGETRKYEDNVIDILMENLNRLWRGDIQLFNQIL